MQSMCCCAFEFFVSYLSIDAIIDQIYSSFADTSAVDNSHVEEQETENLDKDASVSKESDSHENVSLCSKGASC